MSKNEGNRDTKAILGNRDHKKWRFWFWATWETRPWDGLMHALIISPFIRRELQLSFYAKETKSPVHGRPCREGEHSIDFYPCRDGYANSWVRARQNQHNDMCAQRIISLDINKAWLVYQKKVGSLATHKAHSVDSDQTGRIRRLILFLSGRTDHLVDFWHAPA